VIVGVLDVFSSDVRKGVACSIAVEHIDCAPGDDTPRNTENDMITAKNAQGRTRTLDPEERGIDGSGRTVWFIWTHNEDGTLHHMERFHSLSEAKNWMKYA
jgi:hypothetical protein